MYHYNYKYFFYQFSMYLLHHLYIIYNNRIFFFFIIYNNRIIFLLSTTTGVFKKSGRVRLCTEAQSFENFLENSIVHKLLQDYTKI